MSEGRTTIVVFFESGGVTVCYGLWICVTSGRRFFCSYGTWHRVVKQATRDVELRYFQNHVHQICDACRKKACFPEFVCSNNYCSRFQVNFPNQSANLIACNISILMGSRPNFYILSVVCLRRLHE